MGRISLNILSGENLSTAEIAGYYMHSTSAIGAYFGEPSNFIGESAQSVIQKHQTVLLELDRDCVMSLLACAEAHLRVDYIVRCHKRGGDKLSDCFRRVYKERGLRARLDEDILSGWKNNSSAPKAVLRDLADAFNYRHWLAHGRYWTPKLGRTRYLFADVLYVVELLENSFPLEHPA